MSGGGEAADTGGERVDAVVIGGGIAGLTAAHRLVGHGLRPVVLEAGRDVGGLVAAGTVAGYTVDVGAESFSLRRPEVLALVHALGLTAEQPGATSWVWSEVGGAARAYAMPRESILGIPADPFADDVVAALGADGAAEAARDADLGPDVGADAPDLATLVRTRMGTAVLERLVVPVAGGIHNADPADLAVDSVAPGLRAALAEHGSLAAAVRALRAAAPPGAAVATTVGGLFRLPGALATAVTAAGGEVRTATAATGLRRLPGGDWLVTAGASTLRTPRVVVATPGAVALELLRGTLPLDDVTLPAGSTITHVTLVVHAPELDVAPRGSGLLVPPGTSRVTARALTHLSAKWPWLGATTAPGDHVLRVSYGRPGEDAAVAAAGALRDAATLLGVPLTRENLLDMVVIRRAGTLAATTPAHRDRVIALTHHARQVPGLALAGAWVAGTGLGAVVPHAQRSVDDAVAGAGTGAK
ncbi:MAG: protoporphyrinogen/coproporphyrinogen oxidase [Georgenia sp.]